MPKSLISAPDFAIETRNGAHVEVKHMSALKKPIASNFDYNSSPKIPLTSKRDSGNAPEMSKPLDLNVKKSKWATRPSAQSAMGFHNDDRSHNLSTTPQMPRIGKTDTQFETPSGN